MPSNEQAVASSTITNKAPSVSNLEGADQHQEEMKEEETKKESENGNQTENNSGAAATKDMEKNEKPTTIP